MDLFAYMKGEKLPHSRRNAGRYSLHGAYCVYIYIYMWRSISTSICHPKIEKQLKDVALAGGFFLWKFITPCLASFVSMVSPNETPREWHCLSVGKSTSNVQTQHSPHQQVFNKKFVGCLFNQKTPRPMPPYCNPLLVIGENGHPDLSFADH